MQRPWGMWIFLWIEALDFFHTHTDWMPPLHASSCFSDSVLQYVWGLHLGPGWLCPFIYINLKACWDSPLFHTSSQPVSRSMWLSHSIKTALDIYIILICLPTFLLRAWEISCQHKVDTQKIFAEFLDGFLKDHQRSCFLSLWFCLLIYCNMVRLGGEQTEWNLKEDCMASWTGPQFLEGYSGSVTH